VALIHHERPSLCDAGFRRRDVGAPARAGAGTRGCARRTAVAAAGAAGSAYVMERVSVRVVELVQVPQRSVLEEHLERHCMVGRRLLTKAALDQGLAAFARHHGLETWRRERVHAAALGLQQQQYLGVGQDAELVRLYTHTHTRTA